MKITKGKGKYTGKEVNQPHIKLARKLKDKSSKIIYIHSKWYKTGKGVKYDVKNSKRGRGE